MTERGEDFARWVEPHLTVLARYAARRCSADERDREVADALVRAWQRWPTYDATRFSASAWLVRILVDGLGRRRSRRLPSGVVEVIDQQVAVRPAHDADLDRAIAGLGRRQRDAVDLHHFVGLDLAAVADVTARTPDSVASTLHRARARLCDLLGDGDDDLMRLRLTAEGRRWQDQQPPPPEVPLSRLDAHQVRRPTGRRVSAVAAVGVVAIGCVALVRSLETDGHSSSAAAPVPASASPSAPHLERAPQASVPWQDLRAGHPVLGHDTNGVRVTPYDDVTATGSISGSVHPGDTLVFDVVLMAPGLVTLHPCPDYTIGFGAHTVTKRLNCEQVPYLASFVRPDGSVTTFRPVLPAGTAVSFRMQVSVPDEPGRQKVLWTLDGPESTPGFSGTVDVRGPGRG